MTTQSNHSESAKALSNQVDTPVEPLDLRVIWQTAQGELPTIIVGSREVGIIQAIEMLTNKLNEVIDLVATDSDTNNSPSNPPNKHGAGLEEADHE